MKGAFIHQAILATFIIPFAWQLTFGSSTRLLNGYARMRKLNPQVEICPAVSMIKYNQLDGRKSFDFTNVEMWWQLLCNGAILIWYKGMFL